MADGLETATRAPAFAQFAVHAHARADEQGHGGGESREERDEAKTLPRVFAELVGDK